MLVDEGDPLTDIGLNKSISKIKSRNIFKSVNTEIKEGSKNDLRVIDIRVEEQPTGEISAGAGVGTNGGSFAINISENNWLGDGKKVDFEIEVSEESLKGEFSYLDPNYDLLGNSISYNLTNVTNDKPDQGYENKLFLLGASTSFEQFKDIYYPGMDLSYDDLRTTGDVSSSLKSKRVNLWNYR